MSALPLADFCILPSATLLDAAKAIEKNMHRTALVVDAYDTLKVIGVLSEGDILRSLIRGTDVHSPIRDLVRVQFRYLTEDDHEKALSLFTEHGVSLIPVVDRDMHLRSVITMLDCLRRMAKR